MLKGVSDEVKFGYECAPYPWETISGLVIYVKKKASTLSGCLTTPLVLAYAHGTP